MGEFAALPLNRVVPDHITDVGVVSHFAPFSGYVLDLYFIPPRSEVSSPIFGGSFLPHPHLPDVLKIEHEETSRQKWGYKIPTL